MTDPGTACTQTSPNSTSQAANRKANPCMQRRMQLNSNRRSKSISFRLPLSIAEAADERAAQCGISIGNWVRGQVIASVSQPDKESFVGLLEELLDGLEKLNTRLEVLESSQRRTLYYCLTKIGSTSPEAAKQLIRKSFPSKGA